MKKYKSNPTKKYTPLTGQPTLEEALLSSDKTVPMTTPESEDQTVRIETPEATALETVGEVQDPAAGLSAEPSEPTKPSEEGSPVAAQKPKKRLWPQAVKKHEEVPQSTPKDETVVLEKKEEPMNTFPNESNTKEPNAVISKMMNVTGDVELETSLLLAGKVVGNIDCKDAIEVYPSGVVEGNISAASIKLSGGEVKGNITCEGTLETDSETVITGDVSAQVIIVRGKVTGQVKASESVTLSSTAVVKGDLTSATIGVEKGAKLEGKYTVTA